MRGGSATFGFGIGERWALVSAVAYTIVNVTLRSAAPTIDPALGSFVRLIPVAAIAWVIVLSQGAAELNPRSPAFLTWRLVGALLVGGSVSFVLGNILYFMALSAGGLGITVGGVQAGSVLGGLWIGLVILHDRPWREQLAGAAVIVAGLGGIAVAQTQSILETWWLGLLFAIGAGTTYAIANVASRMVQRQRPVLFVTLAITSFGGMAPLALILLARVAGGEAISFDPPSVAAVIVAGCFNALALASLALAVRTASVATVNTISSASIVFSFGASVVVFNEVGNAAMIIGIVLVTAGIVIAQVRRRPAAESAPAEAAPAAAAPDPPQASGNGEVIRRK